jgi:hypothetical protein
MPALTPVSDVDAIDSINYFYPLEAMWATPTLAGASQAIRAINTKFINIHFFPRRTPFYPWAYAAVNGNLYIWCEGVGSRADITSVILNAHDPVLRHFSRGQFHTHNDFAANADNIIRTSEPRQAFWQANSITLIGHSAGHASNLNILARLRASGVNIPIHVFGCGGPKPGWSDILQFLTPTERFISWVNLGDIIPFVPPTASELDHFSPLIELYHIYNFNPDATDNLNAFVQEGNRVILDNDGKVVNLPRFNDSQGFWRALATAWHVGTTQGARFSTQPHWTAEYRRRIGAYMNPDDIRLQPGGHFGGKSTDLNNVPYVGQGGDWGSDEPSPPINPNTLNIAQRNDLLMPYNGQANAPQFEQLGPLGRPPNQLDLLGGMNIVRVPIEYPPNAIHVGRANYGLYWGGQFVANFPTKGQAEKAGNLILRAFKYLTRATRFSFSDLGNAMQTFLTEASGSEGAMNGFQPPLPGQ